MRTSRNKSMRTRWSRIPGTARPETWISRPPLHPLYYASNHPAHAASFCGDSEARMSPAISNDATSPVYTAIDNPCSFLN